MRIIRFNSFGLSPKLFRQDSCISFIFSISSDSTRFFIIANSTFTSIQKALCLPICYTISGWSSISKISKSSWSSIVKVSKSTSAFLAGLHFPCNQYYFGCLRFMRYCCWRVHNVCFTYV